MRQLYDHKGIHAGKNKKYWNIRALPFCKIAVGFHYEDIHSDFLLLETAKQLDVETSFLANIVSPIMHIGIEKNLEHSVTHYSNLLKKSVLI